MIHQTWTRLACAVAGLLAVAVTGSARAAWDLNMPVGVTEISRTAFELHMLIFYVCCVICAVVFGVMFYSVFAHRKSVHPKPADFHESTTVEIFWTVIPFVILIAMAIPAAGALIRMEDTRGSDMTVKVTGYQWAWEYEFLAGGPSDAAKDNVKIFSRLDPVHNELRQTGAVKDYKTLPADYLLEVDNRLVLPVGKKIRFLITAHDVIHAWWVPALGMKKDAIPGYINEMWARIDEPGVYRGQCAELCGRDHGFMPIVVEAVSQAKFDAWMAAKKSGGPLPAEFVRAPTPNPLKQAAAAAAEAAKIVTDAAPEKPAAKPASAAKVEVPAPAEKSAKLDKATLMAEGEAVYKQYCVACHQPKGEGMPPAFPSLKGGKVTTGPAEEHIRQIVKGKNAMQAFGPMLDDRKIAAVVTYERNSWGNKAGVVQPDEVKALR